MRITREPVDLSPATHERRAHARDPGLDAHERWVRVVLARLDDLVCRAPVRGRERLIPVRKYELVWFRADVLFIFCNEGESDFLFI